MSDTRKPLPVGTKIRFDSGSIYEITDAPIGRGGGSIIYPAVRYTNNSGNDCPDGFDYVIKECFPVSSAYSFCRSKTGEIVPKKTDADSENYLHLCKERQLCEEIVTKKLYKTAIHTLPIKEATDQTECTYPGGERHRINNVFTVMESLSLKGNALAYYVKNRKMLPLRQSFSVVRQLLCALREIHNAGFLHLDIQTGNVYIQGSLTQGEILTLIDFGCSRSIADDKTDIIADRLVFTTDGFAAPEILMHNDGTLVLTPAADIYSAGCVLLNVLTGKRYDSSELISNTSGRYIDALKLYRINCPKHLTQKLQQIIAKALKNDPSERYGTAEEMLEDIDSFINALPAQVSPLANTAFDAFISYRHGEIDSPVAIELQKSLEHFRAPKSTSPEKRPFKRCYVDDGELSSGYDYAKQLREVLKNSNWLIVVCSPGAGESRWVNEEIDIFLEYHDRSRVLALLTDGEPSQSFPPRLLEETPKGDLLIAADARGRTLKEILKNIRGDALLKLAAPMLQTTFDSLKQREKMYTLRCISAAAAVVTILAVAFGLYAADRAAIIAEQAEQIKIEYNNSLINESLFLTEQAQKRLDEDDRFSAVEMTLQALPSEKQDRPVLARAKYVLGMALDCYIMPGNEDSFTALKTFPADYFSAMFSSQDRQFIFTLEEEGHRISLRNAEYELINTIYLNSSIRIFSGKLLISDCNSLILCAGTNIYRWDYLTNDLIPLISDYFHNVLLSSDGTLIIYNSKQSFIVADARSGKSLKEFPFNHEKLTDLEPVAVSNDCSDLIFSVQTSASLMSSSPISKLYLMDLMSGSAKELFTVNGYVDSAEITGNTFACIASNIFHFTNKAHMCLYNLENDRLICDTEEITAGEVDSTWISFAKNQEGSNKTGTVLFTFSNYCELLDAKTGEALKKVDLGSEIIHLIFSNNGITFFTSDGCLTTLSFDEDETDNPIRIKYFINNIERACVADGFVYVSTDEKIFKYKFGDYDRGFIPIEGISPQSIPDNSLRYTYLHELVKGKSMFFLLCDDMLFLTDTFTGETCKILLPFNAKEDLWNKEYEILGASADGESLLIKQSKYYYSHENRIPEKNVYYIFSIKTGDIIQAEDNIWDFEGIKVYDTVFFGGKVYYAASEQSSKNSVSLYSWIPGENETKCLGVYRAEGAYFEDSLTVDENQICFAVNNADKCECTLISFDVNNVDFNEAHIPLLHSEDSVSYIRSAYKWKSDRSEVFAALQFTGKDGAVDNILYLAGTDGKICELENFQDDTIFTAFSPTGRRLVYCPEGITEYSSAGNITEYIDLYGISDNHTDHRVNWLFAGDDALAISDCKECILLSMSNNRLGMEAFIHYGIGFDGINDRIVAFCPYVDKDLFPLGTFHHYTTEELVKMGQSFIGK